METLTIESEHWTWNHLSYDTACGMWVVFVSESWWDSCTTTLPKTVQLQLGTWEGGREWKYLVCGLEQHDLSYLLDEALGEWEDRTDPDVETIDLLHWKNWIASRSEKPIGDLGDWTFVIENSRGGQLAAVESVDFLVGVWNALRIIDGSDEMSQPHFRFQPVRLFLIPETASKWRKLLLVSTLDQDSVHLCLDFLFGAPDSYRTRFAFDWSRWPLVEDDHENCLFVLDSYRML
jgi:hypothetical protein